MNLTSVILGCCAVILYSLSFGRANYSWKRAAEELSGAKRRFSHSKSDIFFLMDDSISLLSKGQNGFEDEKDFIESLLSDIRITTDTNRVTIIRFGIDATVDINYISNVKALNNKCEFKKTFENLEYSAQWWTNINDAFQKVIDVLYNGKTAQFVRPWKHINPQSQVKRVKKVIFLITDGKPTIGGNPTQKIDRIKNNEKIEIFTVGVADADKDFLKKAANSERNYFYAKNFDDFADLTTYIRGGR